MIIQNVKPLTIKSLFADIRPATILSELKARRAKWGFQAYLSVESMLRIADVINNEIGSEALSPRSPDAKCFCILNSSGSSVLFQIYFNDESMYLRFKEAAKGMIYG